MEEVCRGVARAAWRGSIPLLMIQWLRATSKPGSDLCLPQPNPQILPPVDARCVSN